MSFKDPSQLFQTLEAPGPVNSKNDISSVVSTCVAPCRLDFGRGTGTELACPL